MHPYTSCFLLPSFSWGGMDKHLHHQWQTKEIITLKDQLTKPLSLLWVLTGVWVRGYLKEGAWVTQRQWRHQRTPIRVRTQKLYPWSALHDLQATCQAREFPLASNSYCLCKLGEAPSESCKFQELPETHELLASWALLVWLISWVLESLSKMEFSNWEEIAVQHLCTEWPYYSVTIF